MKIPRRWSGLIALLTALVALLAVMAWSNTPTAAQSAQAPSAAPAPPAWVGPGGVLDRSKLPSCIHVVGPDGKRVKDQSGNELCVKAFDPPVTEPAEEVKKRAIPSGGQVPWQRPPGAPAGPNDPPRR